MELEGRGRGLPGTELFSRDLQQDRSGRRGIRAPSGHGEAVSGEVRLDHDEDVVPAGGGVAVGDGEVDRTGRH